MACSISSGTPWSGRRSKEVGLARVDPEKKSAWKDALLSVRAPWVLCGLPWSRYGKATSLEGMVGLVDWMVHGQVSRLVLEEQLSEGECCLVPGAPERGLPSFLIFAFGEQPAPQKLAEKTRKLGIKDLALAESTFPEDFLSKLKQTLKKEDIRFTTLEPQP